MMPSVPSPSSSSRVVSRTGRTTPISQGGPAGSHAHHSGHHHHHHQQQQQQAQAQMLHHHHHHPQSSAVHHSRNPSSAAPGSYPHPSAPSSGGPLSRDALNSSSAGGYPLPPSHQLHHHHHPSQMSGPLPPQQQLHSGSALAASGNSGDVISANGAGGATANNIVSAVNNGEGNGSGANSGPSSEGGPGAGGTDAHNASIRSIIERGHQLNAEACQAQSFSHEKRRLLPLNLQKLQHEQEACFADLASIAWILSDYEKARRNWELAIKKNPLALKALQGLARYWKHMSENGSAHPANGGHTNGRNGSSAMNGVDGPAKDGWNMNGANGQAPPVAAVQCHNKSLDYAARSLAIDENGNDGEMWSTSGHALLHLAQLNKAYSCYQQAIAKATRKDDPQLWYGIGILYDRYGSMEHAEEAFASVLKLDPNFHKRDEAFFRLGIIYKLQGKADASLDCFHYVLDNPPAPMKQADIWYQIGHALELKKELESAKDAYERVLRSTPEHSKVLQHLGGLYLRETTNFHDPERCIQYITQSLEHDSHDPFSWYLLGRAFMQTNNYSKAYEAYQQAVYRDGKNPAYWCSIGVLYFNITQYHDALDAYTRAVRIHPFIPEIWQNLGILYEYCHDQLGDAADAYYRAVQLDANNPDLNRRLDELKEALETGAEVPNAPPQPTDIMPDSKSWSSIHFDLSGAKPVYLDSRAVGPAGGSPDELQQQQHPAVSPTDASRGAQGQHQHQMQYQQQQQHRGMVGGYPGPGQQNGMRRSSIPRPGSSYASQTYPMHSADDQGRALRHGAGLRASHAESSGMPSSMDLDRTGSPSGLPLHASHGGRKPGLPPSGSRMSGYDARHSPPTSVHELAALSGYPGSYRDGSRSMGGAAGSPGGSPRMRGAPSDYDMYGPPGGAGPGRSAGGQHTDLLAMQDWERMKARPENGRSARRPESSSAAAAAQAARHPGMPLHSPPPNPNPSAGPSAAYPSSAVQRRPLSPTGPAAAGRSGRGAGPVPPAYPYDFYGHGPPPPSGPPGLHPSSSSAAGGPPHHLPHSRYYDPPSSLNTTRTMHHPLDPRYGSEPTTDPFLHERELQARRALEEEERRRRDMDPSRRALSPASTGRPNGQPTGASSGHGGKAKQRGSLTGSDDLPPIRNTQSANQSTMAPINNSAAPKERRRKPPPPLASQANAANREAAGGSGSAASRRKVSAGSSAPSPAPTSAGGKHRIVSVKPPRVPTNASSAAPASAAGQTSGSPAADSPAPGVSSSSTTPSGNGSAATPAAAASAPAKTTGDTAQPTRQYDDDYDDEDTANVLMGLAGGGGGGSSAPSSHNENSQQQRKSQSPAPNQKRGPPSVDGEEQAQAKRPRSEEDATMEAPAN